MAQGDINLSPADADKSRRTLLPYCSCGIAREIQADSYSCATTDRNYRQFPIGDVCLRH